MIDLDAMEARLRTEATDVLEAMPLARRCTAVLAAAIEGCTIPAVDNPAPPSYYAKAATMLLSVIGLRSARACLLVVESGYWPDAQGLKRRLSEVHARAQAVANDTSGDYARLWLEGEPPKVGKVVAKFGSSDLWDLYSRSTHADARSVHQWLSVPLPEKDAAHQGIRVLPEHDERLSNAMLVEVATECRDMAMAQAVARSNTREDVERNKAVVQQLDADCDAAIERWYSRVPDVLDQQLEP